MRVSKDLPGALRLQQRHKNVLECPVGRVTEANLIKRRTPE